MATVLQRGPSEETFSAAANGTTSKPKAERRNQWLSRPPKYDESSKRGHQDHPPFWHTVKLVACSFFVLSSSMRLFP